MSLSAKSISLILFAFACLVTACDDPKEIGLPQGQTLGVFFKDDFNIRASTVLADSVITSGSNYLLAGKASDIQTGTVTATSYFQPDYLNRAEPPTFGAGTTIESLTLVLPYDYVYGDSAAEQRLTVHLLEKRIEQRPYYSSEELPYSAQAVGSVIYKPRPRAAAASRTVRIPLATSVANTLISLSGKPLADFLGAFNGFALVAEDSPAGAVVAYPATPPNSQRVNASLLLSYKEGGEARQYTYPVSSGPINQPYLFNGITGDRAGTVLESILTRSDVLQASPANGEAVYVQGGTGLVARVELGNLTELRQLGNVAINNAELIVHQLAVNKLPAATPLMLYESNAQGNLLRDPERTWPIFVTQADFRNPLPFVTATNNAYTFNITAYIGRLLREGATNKILYLSLPSIFTDVQLQSRTPIVVPPISLEESIGGLVLGGPQHPSLPMKLRIYYTPVTAN